MYESIFFSFLCLAVETLLHFVNNQSCFFLYAKKNNMKKIPLFVSQSQHWSSVWNKTCRPHTREICQPVEIDEKKDFLGGFVVLSSFCDFVEIANNFFL